MPARAALEGQLSHRQHLWPELALHGHAVGRGMKTRAAVPHVGYMASSVRDPGPHFTLPRDEDDQSTRLLGAQHGAGTHSAGTHRAGTHSAGYQVKRVEVLTSCRDKSLACSGVSFGKA